jgi:hypothetical protein
MRIAFRHLRSSLIVASILAIVLLVNRGESWAQDRSVAGEYACVKSCSGGTALTLQDNGYWGWGKYTGQYQVKNGRVEFVNGNGGPVTWGSAAIGSDTLTFMSGGKAVVYQKSSGNSSQIALGRYYCRTAPGGCQTRFPIEIKEDGQWSWGSGGGSFTIVGGQVQFKGNSSGPPGWGPAEIRNGALVFSGPSEWRLQ